MIKKILVFVSLVVPMICWWWWQHPGLFAVFSEYIPAGSYEGGDSLHQGFLGGDHLQIFYLAAKLKYNLQQGISIFADPLTFAAKQWMLWDFSVGIQYWTVLLMQWFFGEAAGYNLGFVVLPTIFSALTIYFMLRALALPSLLCLAFAWGYSLLPDRMGQIFGGHSGGSVFYLLPLFWGAALRQQLRGSHGRWDLLAGFVLWLLMLSDEHQAYYVLLASLVIFPLWLAQDGWLGFSWADKLRWLARKWGGLLVGVVATLGVGLVERWFLFSGMNGDDRSARSFGEISAYSHRLGNYLRRGDDHTIGQISWIAMLILLMVLAILVARKQISWRTVKLSPSAPLVVVLPLLLLLMAGIGNDWSQQTGLYELAYTYLPFFSAQRAPGKLFGLNALFIILVLVGASRLLSAEINKPWLRPVLIVLLLFTGIYQSYWFVQVNRRARSGLTMENISWELPDLFAYLRKGLGADAIVLNIPFNEDVNRLAYLPLYLALRTKARFASGYYVLPPVGLLAAEAELSPVNQGQIEPATMALAQHLGYTHVLVVREGWELKGSTGEQVNARLASSPLLSQILCEGRLCLYKILTQRSF